MDKNEIKETMELKPRNLKTFLEDWKEAITKTGATAVWPSWLHGTYIKEDNLEAQSRVTRRAARVYPDIKTKVVRRHNKNVVIAYNRKTGAIIPTSGMSRKNREQIDARNTRVAKQREYFKDNNHLDAITAMMGMPRNMRRSLCRKLNLIWGSKDGYREAEAMILEG